VELNNAVASLTDKAQLLAGHLCARNDELVKEALEEQQSLANQAIAALEAKMVTYYLLGTCTG